MWKDLIPNMGSKMGSFFYLPRFNLLYRRLKHTSQPPKAINLDQVEEILAEYGLKLDGAPKLPDIVGRSSSLFVGTSRDKLVLKRYKASMSLPAVMHEHSILTYLAKSDFPTPCLVHTL